MRNLLKLGFWGIITISIWGQALYARAEERIKKDYSEFFSVDANVIENENARGREFEITARVPFLDADKVLDFLIGEMDQSKIQTQEDGGLTYYDETVSLSVGQALSYGTMKYVQTADYGPAINENVQNVMFTYEGDLAFAPYAEAEKEAYESLEGLGIQDVELRTCYRVRYTDIQANIKEVYESMGEELPSEVLEFSEQLSEADEYYLFEFVPLILDVPVKEFSYFTTGYVRVPSGNIQMAVSVNGIEYLTVEGIFYLEGQEETSVFSAEEILEYVNQSVSNKLMENKMTVREMRFVYYPLRESQERYRLIPAWELITEQSGWKLYQYFDARNGEEIIN